MILLALDRRLVLGLVVAVLLEARLAPTTA
jgi:hypothetical protein